MPQPPGHAQYARFFRTRYHHRLSAGLGLPPYDRLSPQVAVMSERMATLAQLPLEGTPHILVTTISAAQHMPPRICWPDCRCPKPGNNINIGALAGFERHGYSRCSTVMEPGDYAVRGGIIDLFAPGSETPVRLDLFGDTLESIRPFDPESQRTIGQLSELTLTAAGEIHLDEKPFRVFGAAMQAFGTVMSEDPFTPHSDGARHQEWSIGFHCFTTRWKPYSTIVAARFTSQTTIPMRLQDRQSKLPTITMPATRLCTPI